MKFFTKTEFEKKYPNYSQVSVSTTDIEAVSEMVFSQIGLRYRDTSWNETSVPLPIKNATMEQLRFMLEHDIPFIDVNKKLKAGSMDADINSDYSTLTLRILANNGYLFRGSPMTSNMSLDLPFGG